MRSLILLPLIGCSCLPSMAQRAFVLAPPDWERVSWRPVVMLTLPDFDAVRPTPGFVPPGRQLRKLPGAVVEVIGRFERPLDRYIMDVLPRLNVQFRDAFHMGQASSETRQILSQFMGSEPGRFIAQPASLWYNGTMPEALRWEGMWGTSPVTSGITVSGTGASKTQTLMNRGSNR